MTDLIGQTLGQYEITSLIGVGSTAVVYQARPAGTASTVAIKVIETRLARDPEAVRRFGREAEAIAALSHPNIFKLFGHGQQGDWLYLVMELLPGGSLAQRIHERPLSGARAARYLDQIARALDYAHGESIIHRDLRPQNVLFDRQGNAILADFGIAALLARDPTSPSDGTILGAPAYMAPEQWQSRDVDGRADLYALGVVVYEMLVGQTPFQGNSPVELMRAHLGQPPPSIRAQRPDLPESIEAVLDKALAKAREARFQSGTAFAEAFRTALSGRIPDWLDVGVPPGSAGASAGFPRRRFARRANRRAAAVPAQPKPAAPPNRRIGLFTVGLVAVVGVAAIAALLLTSRGRNGPDVPPTTTLQLAVAPSLTAVPLIDVTTTRVDATNTAVLAPSRTPRPSLTPTRTPSAAPSETVTPDIPATVAQIVAMTETAAATLASPTLAVTPSLTLSATWTSSPTGTATPTFTPSATPTGTITPDIPATVAQIVGQTNTAVALAASPTPTITPSFTASATRTATFTPTPSQTASPTRTATVSFTPSTTPTGTITPDIPATVAHIVGQTNTAVALSASPTATVTPTFTASATQTASFTPAPSQTASPTGTATPSFTPSMTPTSTITPDIPATVAHIVAMTDTAAATLAMLTPTPTPSSTPGATATRTPTPTATTTLAGNALAITNADFANLRAGPGTSFVRLGIATMGQSFPIIGRTVQGNWLQIILPDGRAAWVSAGLVQISPSDAAIPVATNIPITPSPTPTPES